MTWPDELSVLHEALWSASCRFGVPLDVETQTAIAVRLHSPRRQLTPQDVRQAFASAGAREPSAAFSHAVLKSLMRLRPPHSLLDVLLAYRAFAIDALSAEFG